MEQDDPFSLSGPGKYHGLDLKENEYPLSELEIDICHKINKDPDCVGCLERLWNYIFQYGLELSVGGKPQKLNTSLREVLNTHYISFCKDFMKWYFEVGIVPVCKGYSEDGVMIPVVPGDDGFITVQYDVSERRQVFKYYRRTSKKNTALTKRPVFDKDVIFFAGYGHNPTNYGEIESPIRSLFKKNISLTDIMNRCAVVAEKINSNPRIITQFQSDKPVQDAFRTNLDLGLYYANRDRNRNRE